ncbi:TolC family protein [Steroidobacter agaridevorans]|uniref:TolC family protein n=1 Tax=Steroidobacter agaridevorans TaxID=2695856 RepID=UPI00137B0CD0|nr:TolC family protein [Steroidobacter agaridevorans]
MRAPPLLATIGLCLSASAAWAQAPANGGDFDTIVANYVAEGLRSNLALQSEHLEVEKAAEALSEARARFFPEVSFEARYTRADGGRVIDIPIGTSLNPVYSTLNEMLVAQGQPARFPQLANETIPFLRTEEQDTRLLLRQPLYAPAIPAAVRAQRALLDASSFNRMAIARALRRDITVSYVDWLKARSSVEIVAASEALLRENLRVNESLFGNGKITEDLVLRAKAELLDVEQQKREAENLATQAQSFFNFLLNRQLQSSIEPSSPPNNAGANQAALEQLWSMALDRRPEIAQAEQLRRASEEQTRIARKQKWPTLSLGVDAGTQGEDYRFGDGYNFGTASLIFTWRIFDGGGDTARVHQARAAEKQLVLRQEEIAQQIRLEVQQSYDRLTTARDSLATAAARADAARAAFRIASRKRDEGVISQVEFIDARSALTGAELNHNLTRFNVLARRAELEYATSTGDIPLDPGV